MQSGKVSKLDDWKLICIFNCPSMTVETKSKRMRVMVNMIMDATWANQDGYGEPGFTPPQGWDWSGIRDSSPAAIKKMADAIREILASAKVETLRWVDHAAKRYSGKTTVERLAQAFSYHLREALTAKEMREVVKRNRGVNREWGFVCHSHDFCDANEVMADAFSEVVGRPSEPSDNDDARIWSKAWNLAFKKEFKFD